MQPEDLRGTQRSVAVAGRPHSSQNLLGFASSTLANQRPPVPAHRLRLRALPYLMSRRPCLYVVYGRYGAVIPALFKKEAPNPPQGRCAVLRSWGSGALTLRSVGQGQCRVALGGATGGCSRHDHLGATSRADFLRRVCGFSRRCPRPRAWCRLRCRAARLSLIAFAVAAACLWLFFCVTRHLGGLTRTSGGTAAAVLRACCGFARLLCGIPDSFRWLEGTERRRRARSARHLRRNRSF